MTTVVEGRNIVRDYHVGGGLLRAGRTVHAVKGVSFSVQRGKTLAIVGESGCGKSTLARCLNGLLTPTEGEVIVAGASSGWALPIGDTASIPRARNVSATCARNLRLACSPCSRARAHASVGHSLSLRMPCRVFSVCGSTQEMTVSSAAVASVPG